MTHFFYVQYTKCNQRKEVSYFLGCILLGVAPLLDCAGHYVGPGAAAVCAVEAEAV